MKKIKNHKISWNNYFTKKHLQFLIIVLLIISILGFISVKSFLHKDISLEAKGAIVMEMDTKRILFKKDLNVPLTPGSMTKLMSMLIVLENIESGALSYDQKILITAKATGTAASKAGLKTGEQMTVEDLLKCVFLPSGSEAVIALAEHLYGSEDAFVDEMNKKAKELGLSNSHFTNSVGLEDSDHYASAYDIACIAVELTTKYPEIYKITSLSSTTIHHEDGEDLYLKNTNDMLEYDGVDGLKTGSTPNGGYSLTMTYNKDRKHLVYVVIGSDSLYFRKQDCKKLLDAFH